MSFNITINNPELAEPIDTVENVVTFDMEYGFENTVTIEYEDGRTETRTAEELTVDCAAIPKDEYPTRYVATCSESWGQGRGPAGEYDAVANMAQFLDAEGDDLIETKIAYLRGDFDVAGLHVKATQEIINERTVMLDREDLLEVGDLAGTVELLVEDVLVEGEEVEN